MIISSSFHKVKSMHHQFISCWFGNLFFVNEEQQQLKLLQGLGTLLRLCTDSYVSHDKGSLSQEHCLLAALVCSISNLSIPCSKFIVVLPHICFVFTRCMAWIYHTGICYFNHCMPLPSIEVEYNDN